jgi:hypothetical protein
MVFQAVVYTLSKARFDINTPGVLYIISERLTVCLQKSSCDRTCKFEGHTMRIFTSSKHNSAWWVASWLHSCHHTYTLLFTVAAAAATLRYTEILSPKPVSRDLSYLKALELNPSFDILVRALFSQIIVNCSTKRHETEHVNTFDRIILFFIFPRSVDIVHDLSSNWYSAEKYNF